MRLVLAVLVPLLAWAPPASAQPAPAGTRLRLATLAPDGTPWVAGLRALDAALQKRTGQRLGLRVYPGGVQGDDPAILSKVGAGKLDGGAFTGVGLGQVVPKSRVLELPFQVRDSAQAATLRAALDQELRTDFAAAGWVLLGWLEIGQLHLFSTTRIQKPQDLAATKPWVLPGDTFSARLLADLGAKPVELPLPQVREALAAGTLTAVYHAPAACLALQWADKVKFMLGPPVAVGAGALLVRESALAGVSAEDRAALVELATAQTAAIIAETNKVHTQALTTLAQKGIQTVEPSPAEGAAFKQAGHKAAAALAGKGSGALYDKALLDRVEQLLK